MAVSVTLPPTHTSVLPDMVMLGSATTLAATAVAVLVQPLPLWVTMTS
ncbi:MAG: hypothetical protein IPL33_20285 [Sphingobacteriales bacterium]|nr:hypothetical protein [Sphingobacteriales bacterium]